MTKKLLLFLMLFIVTSAMAQQVKVNARMSYYTSEKHAEVIVSIPEQIKFSKATATIDGKVTDLKVGVNLLELPLSNMAIGKNAIDVKVDVDGKATSYAASVVKLNDSEGTEVKIDYITGGLWVDGLPFIPYGYYCRLSSGKLIEEVTEEVSRGFNLISPYQNVDKASLDQRMEYMDRAADMGLKVNYNICSLTGSQGVGIQNTASEAAKIEMLKEEIARVKNHPALLSYYIADEPDGQDVPAELLERAYNLIKELDPYHPISIVIVSAAPARVYAGTHDIVMTDPYVVPNTHAKNAPLTVKSLNEELGLEKSIWLVPQTFGGGEWWQRDPTPQEMRMQCYASAVYGCVGYQSFILRPKSMVMWSEYAKVGMEIAELTPYLLSGESSKVETGDKELVAKAFHHGKNAMVVVVNQDNEPKSFTAVTAFNQKNTRIILPFEHRDTVIRNGVIMDMIEPFGVRVYKVGGINCGGKCVACDGCADEDNPNNLVVNPSFEYIPTVGVPSATGSNSGAHKGSSYFIDSRVAYHGEHSLRMNNAGEGDGPSSSFYPVPLDFDRYYNISIWAKADPKSLKAGAMTFNMNMRTFYSSQRGIFASQDFELTPEWKQYHFTAILSAEDTKHGGLSSLALELQGKGTAWFDNVEILPDLSTSIKCNNSAKSIVVDIANNTSEGEIRYTTDGATPTKKSALYSAPITLSKVTDLKAQIFKDGKAMGVMHELVPAHKALGCNVIYNTKADHTPMGGDQALVDGYVGKVVFNHPRWQRWDNQDMDVTVDLGEMTDVNSVTAWFFHSSGDHVVPPLSVEVMVSEDGKNFTKAGSVELGIAKNLNAGKDKYPVTIDGIGKKVRYVRMIAKNHGDMPDWFLAGGKAWIYCDELIVE